MTASPTSASAPSGTVSTRASHPSMTMLVTSRPIDAIRGRQNSDDNDASDVRSPCRVRGHTPREYSIGECQRAVSFLPSLQRSMQHVPARSRDQARHAERKDTACGCGWFDLRPCSRARESARGSGSSAPGVSFVDSLDSLDMLDWIAIGKLSSHVRDLIRTGVRLAPAQRQPCAPPRNSSSAASQHRAAPHGHGTLAALGEKSPAEHRSSYVSGPAGANSARYMHHVFEVSPETSTPHRT
jgi:hypothetical protein